MDNGTNEEFFLITRELISELKAELRRTGLGPHAILRGTRHHRPKGVNTHLINKWLNGSAKTASRAQVDFVRQRWASFPDKKDVWLSLDDRKRQLLKKKLNETGLSVNRLFSSRADLPEGLNWKILHAYFAPSRPKIKKEYYHYILMVCEENKDSGYIPVSEAFREKLKAEITRTGVKPLTLIKALKKKNGAIIVQAFTISAWLSGRTNVADQSEMNWILSLYTDLPDRQVVLPMAISINKNGDLSPISEDDLELLKQYRNTAGILPGFIFMNAEDIPIGLTSNMIGSWLNGITKKANPTFVQWTLKRCREVVKAGSEVENL